MDHVPSQPEHDAGHDARDRVDDVAARREAKHWLLLALCIAGAAGFMALGLWQVERRAWKLDLIERVDARLAAPPVAAPARAEWTRITASTHEYRRVRLQGRYRHDRATLVDALTERGAGDWIVTPLDTRDGTILVNRGFAPEGDDYALSRPAGIVTVTGLLRMSEPGGRFLRDNDPRAERWYSRDVAAIAARRGLDDVAPFFIDADRSAPHAWPIGGLTVVRFPDNHLIYAITWFGLAGIAGFGAWRVLRDRR